MQKIGFFQNAKNRGKSDHKMRKIWEHKMQKIVKILPRSKKSGVKMKKIGKHKMQKLGKSLSSYKKSVEHKK